jgi:ribonuclease HI
VLQINAYIDGSFKDGRSSSAILIVKNSEILYKNVVVKFNNYSIEHRNVYAELYAGLMALYYFKNNGIKNYNLYYDFIGIENYINGNWKLKNLLAKKYKELFNSLTKGHKCTLIKVKSHSGDYYNDMVDFLAKKAIGVNLRGECFDEIT